MTFKAVGSGQAQILFSDAVVTANDGRGTNVLSKIEGIVREKMDGAGSC